MIAGRHRFHGYGSLNRVYQRGQNVRGPMISLRYAQRGPERPYRVAVVVSRKVSKSAVTRNRIRRRIYEIVRQADADIAPGTDLIFTVFGEQLATSEAVQLKTAIHQLLQKAATSSSELR
jgi:ribonuclease P protein component